MGLPRMLAAAGAVVAVLVLPGVARAAAPPDPHDPCARGGHDSCGTLGVGFYGGGRYGVRWYGDYRGAVPGEAHTFCIDLRFWYASRRYRYRPKAGPLRNRDGALVPVERRRRIAYAIWRYGRSGDATRQAAVMLYVHALMGDGRPGELDPAAAGRGVEPLYRRIARDSARFHGPYRIEARMPAHLLVGRPAAAAVRVVSAAGLTLPYVTLAVGADGAGTVPARVRTNAAGVARFRLTPTTPGALRLRLATEPLAAPEPPIFAPTEPAARANGQRLAVPAARAVTRVVSRTDVTAAPALSTHASAQTAAPGTAVSDTVTVSGIGAATVSVHAELWGPFASRAAIACTGTPYWSGDVVARGNGSLTTPPVTLERAGYYAFRESITAQPRIRDVLTPCGDVAETTVVRASPTLATEASSQVVRAGSQVSDRIAVGGLGRTPARIEVELFGPFASRGAVRCDYRRLARRARIAIAGSGEVRSPPLPVARAGFYAFRERLVGTPLVAGTTTPCALEAETTLAAPQIVTGRGDTARFVAGADAGGRTPVRIRIAALGIDAAVTSSAIDLEQGVLGIPSDIHRVGWWRDGALPGDGRGTVLVAGHVDSARAGAGAFFRLGTARVGTEVRLATRGGGSFAYRVTSVRTYAKSELPTGVFRRTGPARLVLVTCGGPFDAATGHYRDDVVVIAEPRGQAADPKTRR